MTDLEKLERLTATRAAQLEAWDREERDLVRRLREAGYVPTGWAVIGRALGIGPHAAMRRHADALEQESPPGSWAHRRRWDTGRTRS